MISLSRTIITELEAIEMLTGVSAELVAGGRILGGEGGSWIAVTELGESLRPIFYVMHTWGTNYIDINSDKFA